MTIHTFAESLVTRSQRVVTRNGGSEPNSIFRPLAAWRANEEATRQTVDQDDGEPELPILHRRDDTALAVERLFQLHGFPPAEWAIPHLNPGDNHDA